MEQVFKANNGWYLFIQDSSEGGYDFTLYDNYKIPRDGGLLELEDEDQSLTDVSVLQLVLNELKTPRLELQDSFYSSSSWKKEEIVTRDYLDKMETKDMKAKLLVYDYKEGKFTLDLLHEKLINVFGSITIAFNWLLTYWRATSC